MKRGRQSWAAFFLLGWLFAAAFVVGFRAAAAQETRGADEEAAVWLVTVHQNADGGYTGFSTGANQAPSSVEGTTDAVLALATAGYDVTLPYLAAEQSSLDFLSALPDEVAAYAARDGGTAGKLVLALVTAGQDPRDFAGQDLVLQLTGHLSPTGEYGVNNPFGQSLALLALTAAEEPVAETAVEWLRARQLSEGEFAGSWDDGFGTEGNIDATALAVMALLATGVPADDPALEAAIDFLAETQLESGDWPYAPGLPGSANSTALAVQALIALGEDVETADNTWAVEGVSPLEALLSWQDESGAFQADFGDGPFADFFATIQALPAAALQPFPAQGGELIPVPVAAEEAETVTVEEEVATEEPATETPTPTPEPVEEIVVVATERPTATPEPSLTNAGVDEALDGLAEAEATDSWVAWLLMALSVLAVLALIIWLFVIRKA